jgi:hypothetical protein
VWECVPGRLRGHFGLRRRPIMLSCVWALMLCSHTCACCMCPCISAPSSLIRARPSAVASLVQLQLLACLNNVCP